MSTIKLPEYIIFSDDSRILTSSYKQNLKNEVLYLTAEDGHSIALTRASNGNVGILAYNTPVRGVGQNIELSKDTEEELKNLNIEI